jgi:signal transduction histidine kinase/ligand-binding sensor domain-containing protein/AraC-like DNA-binding protein
MIRYLLCLILSLTGFMANAQIQFKHFDTKDGLPNNSSQAILRDSYGFLWVGTTDGLCKYDGTRFQNYSVIDSSNGTIVVPIYKLFEDSKKQLWIGTNRGLSCYDRKHDSFILVLKNVCVTDIDESRDGILWVSTFSGIFKVQQRNRKILKSYNLSNKIPSNIISQSEIDSKGILWVGTQSDGLFTLNPKTEIIKRFTHDSKNVNSISSNRIKTFSFDKNGKLWIGTNDAGLCVLDTSNKQFRLYNINKMEVQKTASNIIESILIDSKNDVWFSHNGCLTKYNRKTDDFVKYPAEKYNDRFLNSYNLCFITEDYNGNFWFGTFGTGIYCWNKQNNNFKIFNCIPEKNDGLKNNGVNSFVEYNGKIIIGTYEGLQYFNPKTNTFSNFENKTLNSESVISIAKYNNELWCTTWGQGLFRLQLQTNTLTHFIHENDNPNSISTNAIRTTAKIDTLIWIATWGDGIEAFDKNYKMVISHDYLTDKSKVFSKPNWVSKIIKDSKNRIWITTMSGVYVKDGKTFRAFHYDSKNPHSISEDIVNSVFEDSKHQIWLITGRGLVKYIEKTDDFERFGKQKNLPTSPRAILEDSNQTLWISSTDAIYSFNEKTGIVRKYNSRNELIKDEFNSNSALKTSDGTMYFGGKSGFISFKPELVKSSFEVPKIVFRHLYVDNVIQNSLDVTDSVSLQYSNSVITIYIADLQDIISNFALFEYSFDGKKTWKTIDESRKITFSNKQPGSYVLNIKASYNNGKYSEKSLVIIVIPPWWKTWWFKIGLVLLLMIIITTIIWNRFRLIKQKNLELEGKVLERTEELITANDRLNENQIVIEMKNLELNEILHAKDELIKIVSHDFKNPLSGIIGMAGLLKNETTGNKSEKIKLFAESILTSATTLVTQMTSVLDWAQSLTNEHESNPIEINLEVLLDDAISLVGENAIQKNISITKQTEFSLNAFIDPRMISTVFRNLLSNAIKFTHTGGSIHIMIQEFENGIDIVFIDTGVGIKQDILKTIFNPNVTIKSSFGTANEKGTGIGLKMCKTFIDKNSGHIRVMSEEGKGSTFTITLPKGQNLATIKSQTNITLLQTSLFQPNTNEKITVLVIDDSIEIREIVHSVFEGNYTVLKAEDGNEGLYIAQNMLPDIIISDINLPGKNGIEICKILKSNDITCHIPILLITSQQGNDIEVESFESGANDFIEKPFNPYSLKQKVLALLEYRGHIREEIRKSIESNQLVNLPLDYENKIIRKVIDLINNNLSDPEIDTETVVKNVGVSRAQLWRIFKKTTGKSLGDYIREIRMKKAAEMLKTGKYRVSEVAMEVGFYDAKYFTKSFLKEFGMSPSQYISISNK